MVQFDQETRQRFCAEVRDWFRGHWRDDLPLGAWWQMLATAGWAFPTWPAGMGGRSVSTMDAKIVAEELAKAGALGPPGGVGQMIGGPLLLTYGTAEQCARWVPALAAGQESWCQLFSEPDAGSDLAAVRLRAERDGGKWVLTGQKLWSREAEAADRGLALARTDSAVPKHKGISLFVVELDQPGVEVRPIRQMNGKATFNEVFLTGVTVPAENLIGELGQGWPLARACLAYEREEVGGGGVMRPARGMLPGKRNGMLSRPIRELAGEIRRSERDQPVTRGTRSPEALIALARHVGRCADPVVRQRLMLSYVLAETNRMRVRRIAATLRQGHRPGPEASIGKLIGSALGRNARDTAMSLLGAEGMLVGPETYEKGKFGQMALSVQSLSIAGGTDEIQRNLIGERVLGLPREPEADRDVPFRELNTGTGR